MKIEIYERINKKDYKVITTKELIIESLIKAFEENDRENKSILSKIARTLYENKELDYIDIVDISKQ